MTFEEALEAYARKSASPRWFKDDQGYTYDTFAVRHEESFAHEDAGTWWPAETVITFFERRTEDGKVISIPKEMSVEPVGPAEFNRALLEASQ